MRDSFFRLDGLARSFPFAPSVYNGATSLFNVSYTADLENEQHRFKNRLLAGEGLK